MVEVTVTQIVETYVPGMEVALIEASDGETYTVRKLSGIWGGFVFANRDNAAADAIGLTFTNDGTQATIEMVNSVTDLKCTIVLFGQ